MTGAVTGGAELHGENRAEGERGHARDGVALGVRARPLAREDDSAAHPANGGGDEGVAEAHALAGEVIDRGRLNDRMTGDAERVVTLIVGEKEDDVGTARLGGGAHRNGAAAEKKQGRGFQRWAHDGGLAHLDHVVCAVRPSGCHHAASLAASWATTAGLAAARFLFSCGSASRSKSCGRFSSRGFDDA
jgi:hypothetical protein